MEEFDCPVEECDCPVEEFDCPVEEFDCPVGEFDCPVYRQAHSIEAWTASVHLCKSLYMFPLTICFEI